MTEKEIFINAVERIGRSYFWYDDNTMVLEGNNSIKIEFNEQGQIISQFYKKFFQKTLDKLKKVWYKNVNK